MKKVGILALQGAVSPHEEKLRLLGTLPVLVRKPEHLKDSKAIVLDPLPRIDEIDELVDFLPNAKYFQQAKNGLYIRAALLLHALGL